MDSEIRDVYEILGRNSPRRVYTWEQMESGVIDLSDDIDKEKAEKERALWAIKQEGDQSQLPPAKPEVVD